LLAVRRAGRIERPTNNMVANAGKILDAPAAYEDHRVLLKIVSDAGDVGGNLFTIGQPDARNFAKRRVGLLRSNRFDLRADAAALRIATYLECARR